jgi:hypothetical protein
MLEQADKKRPLSCFGASMLVVRGRRFHNSAAKFWSALIDELMTEYADCRRIALEAANEGRLDPELLFPEVALQHELNFFSGNADNINGTWRKALADFELYGPPGSVGLRIYSSSGEAARLILPMDCVDAEIFLYLLAWLLEWGDLPLSAWNDPKVAGAFSAAAASPVRKVKYLFDFTVEHKPLREGLFSWRLDLKFERRSSRSGIILPPASLEAQSTLR